MGNTTSEIEPNNSMEDTVSINNVTSKSYENHKPYYTSAMLEPVIHAFPIMLEDSISLELLLWEINSQTDTKKKVQRVGKLNNQADKSTLNDLDRNPNVKYYRVPACSSDVPKVRVHDTVLNIQPKTGVEEVPPRRRDQSQNLSQKSEIIKVIKDFEEDVDELDTRTLYKCESMFGSLTDQN